MLDEEDRKEIVKLQEATHTSVIAFVLSLFIPLVGLILGLKAKNEIDKSEHTKSGSAFAVAAIWIGAIGTLAWTALLALVLVTSVAGHGWSFGDHFDRRGAMHYQSGGNQFYGNQNGGTTTQPQPGDTTGGQGMMGGFNG